KIHTLQQVQNTIMNGIDEVNETMKSASEQRRQNSADLTKMIQDMKQKGFGG
ncbi:MAG: toxic anion resistance protein, partial [Allobaculum sp.]|nr:toxic anion resistance protein [Allobaculum sp.]